MLKRWTPAVAAFFGTLFLLYAMHYLIKPSEKQINYKAAQCKAPPHDCWDGWSKESFPACTTLKRPTRVRGEVYQAGAQICYKSVFYSLERTTFLIAGWFVLWVILVSRALERVVYYVVFARRQLRWTAAAAIILNLWSVWYSCSMPIQYLNDSNYDYFYSQLYYSLSELFIFTVAVILVDRTQDLNTYVVNYALGTSLYHMLQLMLDENIIFNPAWRAMGRNIAFLSFDFMYSVVFYHSGGGGNARRRWVFVVATVIINFLLFQFVFADSASNQLLQHDQGGSAQRVDAAGAPVQVKP